MYLASRTLAGASLAAQLELVRGTRHSHTERHLGRFVHELQRILEQTLLNNTHARWENYPQVTGIYLLYTQLPVASGTAGLWQRSPH